MLFYSDKLFNGKLTVCNNKIIVNVKIETLLQLDILIPNEQRIRDDMKVSEIISYQKKYYKSGKNHFNFLGVISIQSLIEDGNDYLVDGQHRFRAMELLFKEYNFPNFDVSVELVLVNTRRELIDNYNLVNKNTELPEYPEDADKNVVDEISIYFFKEYPYTWTNKKRQIRPFLNKNQFQEAIGFLHTVLNKDSNTNVKFSKDDIIEMILEKNKRMTSWSVAGLSKLNGRHVPKMSEYIEMCKERGGFYLGLYNYTNELYCYDWVKNIVEEYTGEVLQKTKCITSKKRISKRKRQEVWKAYNPGKTKKLCYCCQIVEFDALDSWECGHIVSERDGGTLDVSNLRPVCSSCNKSVGTRNMDEYILENYPYRSNNGNYTESKI